jgi:hypothetical protein
MRYNLETARARLERSGIQVQGTAIFTSDSRPLGLKLLGAVDYLTKEMGFRVNPTDVKRMKTKRRES